VKNLKVLILVFGVLGVIGLFVPQHGFTLFSFLKMAGMGYLVPILGGFVVAAVMGGMALSKPPMQKWQAGVALAGFAAAGVRMKIWEAFKDLGGLFKSIPMLLIFVGVVGGLIVAGLALTKDDK
jgi:hypothetical protein